VDKARRKYLEKMIAELRRGGLTDSIEVDEEQFELVLGGGAVINLHNGFVEWERASILQRGQVLRRFAEVFLQPGEPPATVEEARPNLMLRVRDREWFAVNELRFADAGDGHGPAFTYEPLNEWLAVEVVYDWPTSVSSLKQETLDDWGMSVEEAIRTGRANLRERTEGTFRSVAPGVFASPWQDTYDAARLLLTELISRLELPGDPVALLPQRDHLLLAGSDDESGLGRIAQLAEPLLAEPHRVTGRAFVWREGRWQLFLPPQAHPHHESFRRLVTLTVADDYNEQKTVLEQRHAAAGDDVFVAAVLLRTDNASGETRSVCTWTEGVRTLLPRTDEIAFVAPGDSETDDGITLVAWDRAVAALGGVMEPQGLLPERWLVERFPSEDELRAIG
jgi:hypothetical protein